MSSAPDRGLSVDALVNSANAESQAPDGFAARLQEAAERKGWKQADLARESKVPAGRVSDYWKGPKQPTAAYLFAMARALSVSAEWLALGKDARQPRHLVSADAADWIEVPEFALHEIDELGKMEPISTTLMRRDWLYTSLGDATGLWLARLPARYDALTIGTGTPLFCKDYRPGERLSEGSYYLFRINGGIVMAPFSFRETGAPDDAVHSRNIGNDEDQYQVVARVIGQLARPI